MAEREIESYDGDVVAMIQQVMRETYLQSREEVRYHAEKVRYFNKRKKALRAYLAALRKFKENVMSAAHKVGVALCSCDKKDSAALGKLFRRYGHAYKVGELEHGLCIPVRVPPANVDSFPLLDAAVVRWEERLASLGDDAQLASVDLLNVLQQQQQILQTMSSISKMLHDDIMAAIRKMDG